MDEKKVYKIAISLIPGIGGILARNLIAYVGSVEGVFRESVKSLMKIPGIGEVNGAGSERKFMIIQVIDA